MKKIVLSLAFVLVLTGSGLFTPQTQAQTFSKTSLTAQLVNIFDNFFELFNEILNKGPIFVQEQTPEAKSEISNENTSEEVKEINTDEEEIEIVTPVEGVYIVHSPTPSRTIISGATNVIFLYMTVYNQTNEDIAINQVGFQREGVGSPRDFENVSIFEDIRRITSPTNVSQQSIALFRLQSRPLEVAAQSSKTFVLRGNIADNGLAINNHENYFTLIEDTVEISGKSSKEEITPTFSAPPENTTVRTVDLNRDNDLIIKPGPSIGNDEYLALGSRDTFGYFRLESESDDAIVVQSIEFEISRHTEVFKQVYLQLTGSDNRIVCPHSTVNTLTDVISFRCEDFIIPRSQTVTLAIKGRMDLGFGIVSRGDRFEFELDEPADLFAETVSGLGVNVIDEL